MPPTRTVPEALVSDSLVPTLVLLATLLAAAGCETPSPGWSQPAASIDLAPAASPPAALFEDIAVPPPSHLEPAILSPQRGEGELLPPEPSPPPGGWFAEVIRDDHESARGPEEWLTRSVEHTLEQRMRELIQELERFQGRPESNLDDGARLTKHELVAQLIHLHFLRPGREIDYLDPLLDALENPVFPGTAHTLLRAAFYHDVGREDLRDRILAELRDPKPAVPGFALENVQLCSRVDGFRTYTPITSSSFRPDDRVFLYGELVHLESVRSGDMWRRGVAINVYLYDAEGREADRRLLTPPGGAWDSTPTRREPNHFCSAYRFPLRVEAGEYRLLVQVTDLNANVAATDEVLVTVVR